MEGLGAFFASGVPTGIGDAVGARGAVFDFLEEGADVFDCGEMDF